MQKDNKKKVDLNFLIQYRQLSILVDFFKEIYSADSLEYEIVQEGNTFLEKGMIEKCAENLEVNFQSWVESDIRGTYGC